MFEGEVNTLESNWHIGCKPGILVAPQQSVAKEDYKLAFKKCLVDSFKEEVLNLMRVDNFAEKRANRWGDEYSGLSSSTSHTNAASNNNDYDDDELTSSQQEHDRTKEKHYGLEISHRLLCDACPLLAHAVIHALECHSTDTEEKSHGELVWEAFNDAALDAQSYVYQEEIENLKSTYEETELESNEFKLDMSDLLQEMSVKHNVNVRLVDLCGGLRKPNVSSIRSYDVGSFIEIAGTCTRTGKIKMVESERYYKCDSARCGLQFPVRADVDRAYAIDEPKGCPQTACKTKTCSVVPERVICRDCQELRLQEHATKLAVGSIPRSILVVVEDDLVDTCKAGDDVTITGVVRRRWKPLVRDRKMELELYILAKSIRITTKTSGVDVTDEIRNEFEEFWDYASKTGRRFTFRNHIVGSVCPQLHGLYAIKMAVLLTLMGGVGKDSQGHRIRGQSHLLLIGDPGTGKSQFLRYAAKLSPRSVTTTGIGSTSAGLTCTAVRDSGEWMLEAGALVLADRGVCCIDEFSTIRDHDRATIHEAMEQQVISVAKAGLVCKLNTRTTIIAAANPKGKYDEDESVEVNTAIASPLLSRFDLCFVLLDRPNPNRDHTLSTFVLNSHLHTTEKHLSAKPPPSVNFFGSGGLGGYGAMNNPIGNEEGEREEEDNDGGLRRSRGKPLTQNDWNKHVREDMDHAMRGPLFLRANRMLKQTWNIPKLQAYISWVQETCEPELGPEAQEVLRKYYLYQRKTDDRNASRTTVRLLESLIRMAQAHARLMHQDEVFVDDAIIAVQMVDASMSNSSILGSGNTPMAEFPSDAEEEMAHLRSRIMSALKLNQYGGSRSDDSEQDDGEQWDGGGNFSNSQASNGSNGSNISRWDQAADAPMTSHHFSPHHNRYSRGDGGPNGGNKIIRSNQEDYREEDYYDGQDPNEAELSQASGYTGSQDNTWGNLVNSSIDNGSRKKKKKAFE